MLKVMLKKLMLIFCFAISTSNVCNANTQIGLEIFKINPDTNLELSAQSMTFNNQNQEAHFTDDVIVKYGQLAGMCAHSYIKGSATSGSEEAAKYKKK